MEDLLKRIEVLEKYIEQNKSSSSLDIDLEYAIRERIKPFFSAGVAGASTNTTYTSFNVFVPNVSGYITVNIGGTDYKLLYQ